MAAPGPVVPAITATRVIPRLVTVADAVPDTTIVTLATLQQDRTDRDASNAIGPMKVCRFVVEISMVLQGRLRGSVPRAGRAVWRRKSS
jgi:hypothetical protein